MQEWFTYADLRELLRISNPRTTRRLVRPYRSRCRLARVGSHPRLLLLIPASVVVDLCRARNELWRLEGFPVSHGAQG